MHFGGYAGFFGHHLGFEAKSEVAQERFFQIVWSRVHETSDKTLTEKGQFLPRLDLSN